MLKKDRVFLDWMNFRSKFLWFAKIKVLLKTLLKAFFVKMVRTTQISVPITKSDIVVTQIKIWMKIGFSFLRILNSMLVSIRGKGGGNMLTLCNIVFFENF